MKKSLLFLSLFTALSMASCGGSDIDTSKIALDYGYDYKNDFVTEDDITIGYESLTTKIRNKENFVLLPFSSGCSCWTNFNPIAIYFMNKYNVKFPAINVRSFDGEPTSYGIYKVADDMPSICFFRRGVLVRQTVYGLQKDKSIFTMVDKFEKFMLDNIYLPKMYYVDKDKLDEKIASNEDLNLYVGRNGCNDCKRVNEEVLYDWSNRNREKDIPNNPLYIFDIEQYRGTAQYQPIKDEYGLSNTTFNPIFGYDHGDDKGMLPTFQRWHNGQIVDMITTLNDYLGENHTLDSYFTEERVNASPMLSTIGNRYVLNGMAVEDKDIGQYPIPGTEEIYEYVKKDAQARWHNPIVELYLSTYVL